MEDAARFVAREARRGRRYDGILLDPPTYGHGPGGTPWRLENDLGPLLADVRTLVAGRPAFVACTAHAAGLGAEDLERIVRDALDLGRRRLEVRDLSLVAESGARLVAGWAILVREAGPGEGG